MNSLQGWRPSSPPADADKGEDAAGTSVPGRAPVRFGTAVATHAEAPEVAGALLRKTIWAGTYVWQKTNQDEAAYMAECLFGAHQ